MRTRSKTSRDAPIAAQVRGYLAAQPAKQRRYLKQIRDVIRKSAPGATEAFSYGIPGFRFDKRPLAWYAGWKEHVSIYPLTAGIRRALATELRRCETSKGTIRFPLTARLPTSLVRRMVRARMTEIRKGGR